MEMDVGFTVTLGLLSIIAVTWYIWRKRRMSFFERLGIPGPKPHLLWGNMGNSSKQAALSLEFEKKYGKIYGVYLGAWPFLVVSDPELLKFVQVKEFRGFNGRAKFLNDLAISHPLSKDGMFTQTGEKWKNARSVISPAFTTGKLKRMMPIARDALDVFLAKIGEQGGKTFDINPLFRKLSFDINSRATFGVSTNAQNEEKSLFIRSVYRSFDADAADFLAKAITYYPELSPLPQLIRRVRDKVRALLNTPSFLAVIDTCADIVKTRKENPETARPDLLQGLIDASADNNNRNVKKGNTAAIPLTENEVIANAFGFMIAGFDVIGVMSSFFVHYIVEHPEVQEKLRQEIQTLVKGELDYDALSKLTYLDQVISETLRVFPFSVIGINRVATEEFKYKDLTIPKGMNIAIALHALNMNPNFWEKPEAFDPDRFAPEKNIDNFVYQPFGNGPRNCIGMRFAQVILKAILATLIKNYKLYTPPDAEPFELVHNIFFVRPMNGVQIRAVPV